MRLIYADDAIYELKREFPADDFGKIIRCISRTLTADARENVHGRWISDEDGNIECSVCGHRGVGDLYCERCGAKMEQTGWTYVQNEIL